MKVIDLIPFFTACTDAEIQKKILNFVTINYAIIRDVLFVILALPLLPPLKGRKC